MVDSPCVGVLKNHVFDMSGHGIVVDSVSVSVRLMVVLDDLGGIFQP